MAELNQDKPEDPKATPPSSEPAAAEQAESSAKSPEEVGGPKGPEPTRYGDWEKKGRCIDF